MNKVGEKRAVQGDGAETRACVQGTTRTVAADGEENKKQQRGERTL